jgi:MoaA/NifB/PqqE/SkfB family radical SAM enzyme
LHRLPLVTLYATDRCNSRCVTCDYWRHGRTDVTLDSVTRLLPSLKRLQTQLVLLSGGEPLLNPAWPAITQALRANGHAVWLLTSGLSLRKHARQVAELFDSVTVSLDGTDVATYAAIRGLDAFDKVCEGIRALADLGVAPALRVTLQRGNFRQLPDFVVLAKTLGAARVSFLAVDVANPHAFGRTDGAVPHLALDADELEELTILLADLERDHADSFRDGFIAETPQKLRRIHAYFTAVLGSGPYPQVRCNAPQFSAVIAADGAVQPCFFISGPPHPTETDLKSILGGGPMARLRQEIQTGTRSECKRCVCSLWRDPDSFDTAFGSTRHALGIPA